MKNILNEAQFCLNEEINLKCIPMPLKSQEHFLYREKDMLLWYKY